MTKPPSRAPMAPHRLRRAGLASLAATIAGALVPGAAGLLAGAGPAHAQSAYPTRPIRFVVPYSPGGLPDTVARIVAQRLTERLGQPVNVDNRPGANGVVAAQAISAMPADGYVFLVTDGSMFTINPLIYKVLPYGTRDYVPVALVARAPLFLALHPSVPANTLAEFVALVKSQPGRLDYGSSGIGSTHHLTMEAMKAGLGLHITHIPYKGTGQSVPALIGGQVSAAFSALPSLAGFARTGQVKLVAVNSVQRSDQAPNVPAIAELLPGFDFAPIVGIFAPAGTPPAIVQRVSAEVVQLSKMPEVLAQMKTSGIDAVGGGPADLGKAIEDEAERAKVAARAAQLRPE